MVYPISSVVKHKWLKFAVGICATLLLFYFIFRDINILSVFAMLQEITIVMIAFSFGAYLFSHFLRTIRFYYILNKQVTMRKMFKIVCTHNFLNSVLPMRLGELSYIYLIKKENILSSKGVFTLATIRLFDIFIIFIFFSLALIFTTLENRLFNFFLLSFFVFLSVVLVLIVFFRQHIFDLTHKMHSHTTSLFIKNILSKIIETLEHFGIIKSKEMLFILFITTILIWLSAFLTGYFIIAGLFDISFFIVVLGLCFVMLTYILPVQGFMGFGTTEGSWALVLIFFGFNNEQAILSGFAFHILSLIYTIILGFVSLPSFLIKE